MLGDKENGEKDTAFVLCKATQERACGRQRMKICKHHRIQSKIYFDQYDRMNKLILK